MRPKRCSNAPSRAETSSNISFISKLTPSALPLRSGSDPLPGPSPSFEPLEGDAAPAATAPETWMADADGDGEGGNGSLMLAAVRFLFGAIAFAVAVAVALLSLSSIFEINADGGGT